MKCWVYRSPIGNQSWLITEEGTSMVPLPPKVIKMFKNAEVEKTIVLEAGSRFTGLDVNEAMSNIATNKFHIVKAVDRIIDAWLGVIGIG